MRYLDFELEVTAGEGGSYTVNVRSPAGEATASMRFPFDQIALTNRLQALQIALLRSSGTRRRIDSPESRTVQAFGQELWQSLFTGDVLSRYEASRQEARHQKSGMRIKFRCDEPELAALPWEYLFDPVRGDFVTLSAGTPLVRYIPLPASMPPLVVTPPLRILAVAVSPSDLDGLDVERERSRLTAALESIQAKGLVELNWIPGQTWRDFQEALWDGPWHIFHFIGHGGFDENRKEGILAFAGPDGKAEYKRATSVGRLLGDHEPLRLAVLNACESGRTDATDVFSSTAGTLVRKGTPAVVAMQYEITDDAAIELSRSFYGAVARGIPVDTALTEARKGLATAFEDTLEWGTPVLYLQAPDGVLFEVASAPTVEAPEAAPPAPVLPLPIAPEPEAPEPEPPPPEPPPPEPAPPEPAPKPPSPEPVPPIPPVSPTPAPPVSEPPPLEPPEPEPPTPVPAGVEPPKAGWSAPTSSRPPIALLAGGGAAVVGLLVVAGIMAGALDDGGGIPTGAPPTGVIPTGAPPTGVIPTGAPPTGGTASEAPPVVSDPPLTGAGILMDFDPDAGGPEDSDIYLLDPNTGEATQLTDNDVPDRWPSWSRDATGFAFTRVEDRAGDIYVMDVNAESERQLTSGPDDDWGPNLGLSDAILFNSDRNESDKRLHDIWSLDLSGGIAFVLGEVGADDRSPAWSPDDNRVAYTTDRDRDGRAIYIVEANQAPQRFTFGGTIDRNPSWRPDGHGLVFTRNPDETGAPRDIWSLDLDTGVESPITSDPADEGNPVYSPDASQVAFYRRVGEEWHIFVYDVASGEERDVTAGLGGSATDPSWR